ncbi:RNA-binding domain-containing protein [Methanobacterium paludis]|uniref:UPF0201 protein MSWAN_1045 n=1 Tax=Methanobacterium paludis (strain DSM 25820 / JCM 18151 / SWAN1) TaxID=868131 RepID=F6D3S2_METPW|nr:RNA-binding domain-containing protein [Methanobacterium paludis]AEG18066.1 protein of unknown function DUF54 [Methanobacterium paludis]
MKCKMTARADINPTEDLEKVIKSLSNMFDYDDIEIEEGYVVVSGEKASMERLKESLKNRQIRDTAEKILFKGINGNEILFSLSKQAALVDVANFVDGELSSLGEIKVKIDTDDVEGFIKWITER